MEHRLKTKKDLLKALCSRGRDQERLFKRAHRQREAVFAGRVEVRSVIEYSNLCRQACRYCGLNRYSGVGRDIMTDAQLRQSVKRLYESGRRVVMIQTGESNSGNFFNRLQALLKEIKQAYPDLTLIASFGNLTVDKYRRLRDIGVDRYLLKFETSSHALYRAVKPSDTLKNRLAHIRMLKKLGFHTSSGNITGLPGQTLDSLADDLLFLKDLDLPMGSTSPFIPNDRSLFARYPPADVNLVLNFMAALRILCPRMLIPSTSAMELLEKGGHLRGLMAGANTVTLHDGTPRSEERKYIIYRKDRYIPREPVLVNVRKAGLEPVNRSLVRDKFENGLFYKLVDKNLSRANPAVIAEDRRFRYQDLRSLSSRFCGFLAAHGVREGDRVLLAVYDSIEFTVAFLACVRMGVVVVPADPQARTPELKVMARDCGARLVLATRDLCGRLRSSRAVRIADDGSSKYFLDMLKKYAPVKTSVSCDRNNPALILYTSGTTGRPKGVLHTYKNLFVDNFPRTVLKVRSSDVLFCYSRMTTSFGLGNSLLFPLHAGATVILSRDIPNPFSLKKILAWRPTIFFATPSVYELLAGYGDSLKGAFKGVRLFVVSGEKLYRDTADAWLAIFKKRLLECYGASEMCHPFISNVPGHEKEDSCGRPVDGFDIRLGPGGRLFFTGPSMTPGYLGKGKPGRDRIRRGWFKSEDIARVDGEGHVFIMGRDNLVFKLRGLWVSIPDLEDRLRRCRPVREAAVVKQRAHLDYYVALDEAASPGSALREIRRYCMDRFRLHEIPRKIHVLNKVPRTKTGKIDRRRLKN